ncbi:hypothetical protein, partial [Streptomyces sp. NPDC058297]|uniref:hypothetical protein n=1 Tax=Streptomyces sp. NPDC058297 TaxID=3346433 RepID=UPI0036E30F04
TRPSPVKGPGHSLFFTQAKGSSMADDLTGRAEALLEAADEHRQRGDWMAQFDTAQAAMEAVPSHGELSFLEHDALLQRCWDMRFRALNALTLEELAPTFPEPYDARPAVWRAVAVCVVFAVACVTVVAGMTLVARAPAGERGPLLGVLGVTLVVLAAVQGVALWVWARTLRGRATAGSAS